MTLPLLNRYQLKKNPYDRRELDPLNKPKDLDLLARVDSFKKLDEVDKILQESVDNQRPAYFVVTGRNGSGRSTVANYIVARYCELRGIEPERFVIPDREVPNHDEISLFRSWMLNLHFRIKRYGINVGRDVLDELNTTPKQNFDDNAILVQTFLELAWNVGNALKGVNAGYGVFFENVPTYSLIETGKKIFKEAETVCVFTTLSYESLRVDIPTSEPNNPDILVELNPIKGQDVKVVTEKYWPLPRINHPFDPDGQGIEESFQVSNPIARVLRVLADLLEDKVKEHPEGPPWPEDRTLAYTTDELLQKVPDALNKRWRQ